MPQMVAASGNGGAYGAECCAIGCSEASGLRNYLSTRTALLMTIVVHAQSDPESNDQPDERALDRTFAHAFSVGPSALIPVRRGRPVQCFVNPGIRKVQR